MAAERRGMRRAAALGLWGLAAAHLVEAAVLRWRAARLLPLLAGAPTGSRDGLPEAPAHVVSRAGVAIADEAGVAAARAMAGAGLAVIDLVPADLPVERAMDLLRRVVPDRFATKWLYTPGGAHDALALAPSLARRAAIETSPVDACELARQTARTQRHAPRAAGVRVTDLVRTAPVSHADRWRQAEQVTAFAKPVLALPPLLVAARTAHLLAMTAGALVAPVAAAAAALTWSGQPMLVFAGSRRRAGALRPPRLARDCALRLPRVWVDNVRLATAGARAAGAARAAREQGRPTTPPADDLFDDPRTDCPWCGSRALDRRLDTVDVTHRVPGAIHLDECVTCGHIFQNPPLSDLGLDRCYRDLYDGDDDEAADAVFAAMAPVYRRRTDTIARLATPSSLLDVGTGHGHFCLVARQRWPEAAVDGLDQSAAVGEAQRRGWVDRAYRGAFPDLADGLPRPYDVVTMSHYLEHTRAPRRELVAAAKVLEPGGLLVVEVPDPESPWSRRLGPCWSQWVQPQHLHFVRCANLQAALLDAGFDVVSVERAAAHLGGNLVLGLGQAIERLAPSPHLAWRPRAHATARAWRIAVIAAASPVAAVALAVDAVMDTILRRAGGSRPGDAYRIVARRR